MNRLLLFFLLSFPICALTPPPGCQYDQQCILEVPGSQCADGSPAYVAVTTRRETENLLIYLEGGGACWDFNTCSKGFARPLKRELPTTDWNQGSGIQNQADSHNPFRNFSVVDIPYCTGDVFGGRSTQEYQPGYQIRHAGFENAQLSMELARVFFGSPEKVVLLGSSAGAIGVGFHFRTLERTFPASRRYVISDAGTPFKPPYVREENYKKLIQTWNAKDTLPTFSDGTAVEHFGSLLEYNRKEFPNTRYGLIQSYSDYVMTFFAGAVGTDDVLNAVKKTIIDVADNHIGTQVPNQRVFFVPGYNHTFMGTALNQTESLGVNLETWVSALINDEPYENIRPDLTREGIELLARLPHQPLFPTIDDLWKFRP